MKTHPKRSFANEKVFVRNLNNKFLCAIAHAVIHTMLTHLYAGDIIGSPFNER